MGADEEDFVVGEAQRLPTLTGSDCRMAPLAYPTYALGNYWAIKKHSSFILRQLTAWVTPLCS